MKQYRITSSDFVTPNDPGDPDAYMDPDELERLKQIAGVSKFARTVAHNPAPAIAPKPLREQKYNG